MNLKIIILSPLTAFYNFQLLLVSDITPTIESVKVIKRQLIIALLGFITGFKVATLLTIGNILYIQIILRIKGQRNSKRYWMGIVDSILGYTENTVGEDDDKR